MVKIHFTNSHWCLPTIILIAVCLAAFASGSLELDWHLDIAYQIVHSPICPDGVLFQQLSMQAGHRTCLNSSARQLLLWQEYQCSSWPFKSLFQESVSHFPKKKDQRNWIVDVWLQKRQICSNEVDNSRFIWSLLIWWSKYPWDEGMSHQSSFQVLSITNKGHPTYTCHSSRQRMALRYHRLINNWVRKIGAAGLTLSDPHEGFLTNIPMDQAGKTPKKYCHSPSLY